MAQRYCKAEAPRSSHLAGLGPKLISVLLGPMPKICVDHIAHVMSILSAEMRVSCISLRKS